MASRKLPRHLRTLLTALDSEEKGILRSMMGIDVDVWRLDEAAFAGHEKTLRDYRERRKAIAAEVNARGESVETYGETTKCSGCGNFGKEVDLFITLIHGTIICDRCLILLEQHARHSDG